MKKIINVLIIVGALSVFSTSKGDDLKNPEIGAPSVDRINTEIETITKLTATDTEDLAKSVFNNKLGDALINHRVGEVHYKEYSEDQAITDISWEYTEEYKDGIENMREVRFSRDYDPHGGKFSHSWDCSVSVVRTTKDVKSELLEAKKQNQQVQQGKLWFKDEDIAVLAEAINNAKLIRTVMKRNMSKWFGGLAYGYGFLFESTGSNWVTQVTWRYDLVEESRPEQKFELKIRANQQWWDRKWTFQYIPQL